MGRELRRKERTLVKLVDLLVSFGLAHYPGWSGRPYAEEAVKQLPVEQLDKLYALLDHRETGKSKERMALDEPMDH